MNNTKHIATIMITVLFNIALIASCTPKKTDDATPNVSLKKDILPIFQASCAISPDCHSAASADNNYIDLRDSLAYNTIITKGLVYTSTPTASMLYGVLATGRMPKSPYPKLSAAQVKLVLNWIQQGAKDN